MITPIRYQLLGKGVEGATRKFGGLNYLGSTYRLVAG